MAGEIFEPRPPTYCAEAGPSVSEIAEGSCPSPLQDMTADRQRKTYGLEGTHVELVETCPTPARFDKLNVLEGRRPAFPCHPAQAGVHPHGSTCLRARSPRSQEGEENETLESLFEAGAVLVVGLIVSV